MGTVVRTGEEIGRKGSGWEGLSFMVKGTEVER